MSGEPRTIEHLVFSTRAAEPRSSTEFNREVIAASPGVPEAARRELARLGDMTGPVLRRPGLPPLWAFRRLDEELWLVVRAVSLGLYRKGHHQLLVHGVVLPREVLEELEGDPFLLDSEEARRAGFRFLEIHPNGRSGLDPIPFAAGFAATARRLVRERFRRGSERYGEHDPAFPALHDAVRDRARPTVWSLEGPPDPRFLEWLLLHFHPADRANLSFHTWYAYEQAVAFDLIGAAPEDVSIPRRLLREVRLWSPEAPEEASELGVRVRELRRRDPGLFLQSLERYYFTLLEDRHRLDVRRKALAPLQPREEALLCLRKELGETLTPGEEETVDRLARRGQAGLSRHAADLADAWRQGPAAFRSRLERLVPGAEDAARPGGERDPAPNRARDLDLDLERDFGLERDRLPPVREPEERLGLLALLPRLLREDGEERDRRLRDNWQQLLPPQALDEVLALLEPGPRAELGEEILAPWWPAVARAELAKEDEPEVWPAYLRWLHRAARSVLPAAAQVEELLEEAPREAALAGYRRLARVCSESGLGAFATRLLLQREVPLLAPAAARIRLEDAIRLLLAGDGGADAYLAPYLGEPGTAGAVLESLADRVTEGSTEETGVETWSRCRRLLAAQRRPALPRAAAGAAGTFVARLAASPLADRTAEALDLLADLGPPDGPVGNRDPFRDEAMAEAARRLAATMLAAPAAGAGPARGLAGLLAARLQDRPLGEPEEAVDRALLGALAPALILVPPASGGGGRLRAHLVRYLEHLLDRGRWLDVTGAGGRWRHLLLDELLAEPPHDPEDDPRYRAYLELAWRRWSTAAGTAGEGAAAIAVFRALPLPAGPPAAPAWHRSLAWRGIPAGLRPAAETLLASAC